MKTLFCLVPTDRIDVTFDKIINLNAIQNIKKK